jgi:putative methyltransferase (TIGR04325 family)
MSDRFARVEASVRAATRRRLPPAALARFKDVVFAWTPPVAIDAVRRLRGEWEYVPDGWPVEQGWDSDSVVRSYRAALASISAGITSTGPLGVPLEPHPGQPPEREDPAAHNLALTFGYVLARAASGRRKLSILDWGGGLGAYHLLARSLLPDSELDYHCREVPSIAAAGRESVQTATFHTDDRCLEREYDLVLASSSLQYERDWTSLLERLARATSRFLFLARLPVTPADRSFVVRQNPARYGYATTYAGWVFACSAVREQAARAGLVLEREFLADTGFTVRGAPGPVGSRSYLFSRSS